VNDVPGSAARYAALAGADAVTQANGGARVVLGDTAFELTADQAARAHVGRRGEGPMSLTLRGPAAATLDARLAHGALLSIVAASR
jgi:hypothetical protein